jgi:hypothetical protein
VYFQLLELNNDGEHALDGLIEDLQLPVDVTPPLDEGCDLVLSVYYQLVCLVFVEGREGGQGKPLHALQGEDQSIDE